MAASFKTVLSCAAAIGLAASTLPANAQGDGFDYGDDTSDFAKDGECDDLRFEGTGRAEVAMTDDIGRDATDCRAAYTSGTVKLAALYLQPADDAAIIFGDDASTYANDGECDDVRFAHEDSAQNIYLSEDVGHDATDCKAGFEAGALTWQGHRADLVRGITATELLQAGGATPEPTT